MRLRFPLAGAVALAAMSTALVAAPSLGADTYDTGDPTISPALIDEIENNASVRSIIELKPGENAAAVAADLEQASAGSRVAKTAESSNFFVAKVDRASLDKLRKDSRVQAVYKDELSVASLDASTQLIRSDRANESGWTGKGTTVAVLDTGIDRDHPFFAGRIVDEACFSTSDTGDGTVSLCPNNQPNQSGPGAANAEIPQCLVAGKNECSHGTHVAGIAAGRRAAGAPSDGVAPAAGLLPIQVFSRVDRALTCASSGASTPCYLSYTSDQKLALEYVARVARQHNVAAVNLSLGTSRAHQVHCDAESSAGALKSNFDALVGLGVAPVVAAGNAGHANAVASPACVSSAVAVGATDDRSSIAVFSNRGALLDLLSPGVAINSAVPDNTYGEKSGTSMAAPHVAGAFAVMKQAYPNFTVAQALQRLQATGTNIAYSAAGTRTTTSRINLARATSASRPNADPRV
ncbi:S8 family serine peptidase [Nonomuraea sp. NN258]|uniref:S8 family peptidase n=1 Tax=Nonomuraea antri TaxID=2730852 RepID=UPI001569FEA7|nr:S8 family serine peptidase [Nonomuraea antri]NRQ36486.1 S8 family serine peptidase [Nonomuraea antri]